MKKMIIFLRFMAFSPFQQHGCWPSVRIWIVHGLASFNNGKEVSPSGYKANHVTVTWAPPPGSSVTMMLTTA
jgi:hypothetical protein